MENNITSGANSPNRPQNMDHVAITFRGVPQKNPILRPGCELVATRAASKGNVDRSRAAKRMKRANVRGHTPAIIVGRATGCLILIHVQSRQAIVKKADTPPPSISSGLKHNRPTHVPSSPIGPLSNTIMLRRIGRGVLGNSALLSEETPKLGRGKLAPIIETDNAHRWRITLEIQLSPTENNMAITASPLGPEPRSIAPIRLSHVRLRGQDLTPALASRSIGTKQGIVIAPPSRVAAVYHIDVNQLTRVRSPATLMRRGPPAHPGPCLLGPKTRKALVLHTGPDRGNSPRTRNKALADHRLELGRPYVAQLLVARPRRVRASHIAHIQGISGDRTASVTLRSSSSSVMHPSPRRTTTSSSTHHVQRMSVNNGNRIHIAAMIFAHSYELPNLCTARAPQLVHTILIYMLLERVLHAQCNGGDKVAPKTLNQVDIRNPEPLDNHGASSSRLHKTATTPTNTNRHREVGDGPWDKHCFRIRNTNRGRTVKSGNAKSLGFTICRGRVYSSLTLQISSGKNTDNIRRRSSRRRRRLTATIRAAAVLRRRVKTSQQPRNTASHPVRAEEGYELVPVD
mmetsp:Transcript_17635/g.27545  ORF Transcript_17635/g.27545 Transcript_17635/m.27545 type:complete len:572 (+) Transcript_17635:2162-3877(+)